MMMKVVWNWILIMTHLQLLNLLLLQIIMQDQQQIGPIGEIKHHSHYHPLVVAPPGVEMGVKLGLDYFNHPLCQIHNHPQVVAPLEAEIPLEDLII